MNTKKFLKIYLFICIFPVWVLSEKILFSINYIFFIPYALLYLSLVLYMDLERNYKFTLFSISFLTFFAIDQNLSLSKNLIKPNFEFFNSLLTNIYYTEIILALTLLLIIHIIFYKLGIKSIKIFFSFIFVIFIFKNMYLLSSLQIIARSLLLVFSFTFTFMFIRRNNPFHC